MGVVDEELIMNMSYVFFEDVLEELGHKIIYDAVVNYAGNGFVKDAWSIINEHNPMNVKDKSNSGVQQFASFFSNANIRVVTSEEWKKEEKQYEDRYKQKQV